MLWKLRGDSSMISVNYGVFMKFILSFIFLLSFSAHAKSFDIRCSSKNFEKTIYKGVVYDRGYFLTAGCYELSATFSAEEKALDQCRQWADFYGIKNYEAKIYPRSNDQFTQCHPDSRKIADFMTQKKYNKVPEIEGAYKESGTIIYYTHLYIDNHADPAPIYDQASGRELAQWLLIDEDFFCGKINQNIAFKYNSKNGELSVLTYNTKTVAIYKNSVRSDYYLKQASKEIAYPFLTWEQSQNSMSFIDFYSMKNGKKNVERHEEILYFENNGLCR